MLATDHAVALTHTAARAAAEKKAGDIVAIDVSERLVLFRSAVYRKESCARY